MLLKSGREGLIKGLCPDFVPEGVICLQYADDTLRFLEKDSRIAKKYEVDSNILEINFWYEN
jgi:hypothetical protein